MANDIFEIPVRTIDGDDTNLGQYKGKTLLIVNVASKCGLTPQYEGLENLYEEYRDRGFEILGFPCNDFKGQEPGSEEEIKDFCSTNYNVTFPLFSKVGILENRHPLYAALIEARPETDVTNGGTMEENLRNFGHTRTDPTDVLWNFEKFLVSRNGDIVSRFAPDVTPDDERLRTAIESDLAG
ncbi:MAG: redoxin domain-containing protein [Acidobacteria bacterium]|nr:redoxin domain-containing protein [Acidobacteriota bacterium]MCW5948688.1 redoxin domain-containing protein [Pyrinomonadaceae bacterium]